MNSTDVTSEIPAQDRKAGTDDRDAASRAGVTMDVPALADLLRETSEHHDHYEKTHQKHNWWDWYAAYMRAREDGSAPEQAVDAAGLYMEQVLHVLPA
jgi:hypothetical protein